MSKQLRDRKQRNRRGSGSLILRGNTYSYRLSINGHREQGSTGCTSKEDAQAFLNQRLVAAQKRGGVAEIDGKYTVAQMLKDYKDERLAEKGTLLTQKYTGMVIDGVISPFFGAYLARKVDFELLRDFKRKRLDEGRKPTTVNRNFHVLRSAYRYAAKRKRISWDWIPDFELVLNEDAEEQNARQGFIELEAYPLIHDALPPALRPLFTCAYFTGIRKGTLLQLQWQWVDFKTGLIFIPGSIDKAKRDRFVPITDEMREALTAQKALRDEKCLWCERVFFWHDEEGEAWGHGCRLGDAILDFRGSWDAAVAKAGYPDALFHDCRRSAVKNMIDSGISETEAMRISGHRTRKMLERYKITDRKNVIATGKKISAFAKKARAAQDEESLDPRDEMAQLVARMQELTVQMSGKAS